MNEWVSIFGTPGKRVNYPANGRVFIRESDGTEREAWFIERKSIFVSPDFQPPHSRGDNRRRNEGTDEHHSTGGEGEHPGSRRKNLYLDMRRVRNYGIIQVQ